MKLQVEKWFLKAPGKLVGVVPPVTYDRMPLICLLILSVRLVEKWCLCGEVCGRQGDLQHVRLPSLSQQIHFGQTHSRSASSLHIPGCLLIDPAMFLGLFSPPWTELQRRNTLPTSDLWSSPSSPSPSLSMWGERSSIYCLTAVKLDTRPSRTSWEHGWALWKDLPHRSHTVKIYLPSSCPAILFPPPPFSFSSSSHTSLWRWKIKLPFLCSFPLIYSLVCDGWSSFSAWQTHTDRVICSTTRRELLSVSLTLNSLYWACMCNMVALACVANLRIRQLFFPLLIFLNAAQACRPLDLCTCCIVYFNGM